MKHSLKITILLLAMFLIAQLIGLTVNKVYEPKEYQLINSTGQKVNVTEYNLPYGFEPPAQEKKYNFLSVIIALAAGIVIIFLIMKFHAETVLRWWFFIVIIVGLAVALSALLQYLPSSSLIALFVSLVLAYMKVFKRDILTHNLTEVLVYPGISAIFVPLFNVFYFSLLLILISFYDIFAVWHSGFMQKMAKYQMQKVKVFAGLFVPYIGSKERKMLDRLKSSKSKVLAKKIKVQVAILGGGDIIFPMILAGIVLHSMGLLPALLIVLGATLALGYLFYTSKKGKFYPAMPFISIGCFIGLALAALL